eukprot:GGOE01020956.1.p1 GENE.GGOE01020956.1~~GGOE01020956.1.p1  ORF type:complete len:457 (-),score=147.29 GGOE01020956.1:406-1776(-)
MGVYSMTFGFFIVLFGVVLTLRPHAPSSISSGDFRRFQSRFLVVFLTMFAGDWLQGPTVYALYEYYGYSRADNGLLFIVGFGSSLLFGPFAGTLADRYGRRNICLAYGVIYSLCCITKHFRNFKVLLLGRVFGGIATSIVWSGFESWMVSEHRKNAFEDEWLGDTFSRMTIGNGIIAIPAGLVAQLAVWLSGGHPVAPFDVALVLLLLGSITIVCTWKENYGDSGQSALSGLQSAVECVFRDRRILLLGCIQSLFESAMYVFIFIWTPALEASGPVPHGIIFSCFMVCCSLGGTLFAFLIARYRIVAFLHFVFAISAVCLLVPMLTRSPMLLMPAFCVYEVMVGVFWPAIGTLRSDFLPENHRTTIMNLYRVPLNFLVMAVLLHQGTMAISTVFAICLAFQLLCIVLHLRLCSILTQPPATLPAPWRLSPDRQRGASEKRRASLVRLSTGDCVVDV